jgi:hypothetical protein
MPEVSSNPRGNQIPGDASASSASSAFAFKAILVEKLLCNSAYSPNLRASALKTPAPRLHPLSIRTTFEISASFRNFRAQCQSAPRGNQIPGDTSASSGSSAFAFKAILDENLLCNSAYSPNLRASGLTTPFLAPPPPPNPNNPHHFREIGFVPPKSSCPEYNGYTQPPRTARSVSGPRSH